MKVSVLIPVYNQEKLISRAIESVPSNWETIVINDGSTDRTEKVINFYNVKLISYEENKGVGYALNKGLEEATGDYIVLLGSDDYFLPEVQEVVKQLDGTDLVYFNLRINNGDILNVDSKSKKLWVGSVKFMRKKFIKGIKNPEIKEAGEDWFYFQKLQSKNPTEKFTNITAKHYNFPRIGSLSWNANRK